MAPSDSTRASTRVQPHPPHGARRARVALGVAAGLALPALFACNSLIGLNDFDKGECPGARCTDDGSFPDVVLDGGGNGDVRAQDAQPDVQGADPVSWAKWPMPNYGEGGPGQPPNPPVFGDAGASVPDMITKLVWRTKLAPGGQVFQAEAEAACQSLGAWRLPKRIELVTLIDYSRTGAPYIDKTRFTDVVNDIVWTSSAALPFTPGRVDQPYWVVNFTTGSVEQQAANFKGSVLCVAAK